MKQRFLALTTLAVCLMVQGCGRSGIDRNDLSGKITYKGQPVPFGTISFRPNRKKGGAGPSGFAQIVEGDYSTSSSGKGAVSGPVIVMIEGLVANKPMAAALFPTYKTEMDITGEIEELDFEVPEVAPSPKGRRR